MTKELAVESKRLAIRLHSVLMPYFAEERQTEALVALYREVLNDKKDQAEERFMGRRKENSGKWVAAGAIGAIAGAGFVAHTMKDKIDPNPELEKTQRATIPDLNIDSYFAGVGPASQFADKESVDIKLIRPFLHGNGCKRFFDFFKNGVLSVIAEDEGITIGEIRIVIEGIGDIVIPAKTALDEAYKPVLDFYASHLKELVLTQGQLDELVMPKTVRER